MVWLVAAMYLSWIHDINTCCSWSVADLAYAQKWKRRITSYAAGSFQAADGTGLIQIYS